MKKGSIVEPSKRGYGIMTTAWYKKCKTRRGVVIRVMRNGFCVFVLWNGYKTPHGLHFDFVKQTTTKRK